MPHVEGRTVAAVAVFIICNAAGDLILSHGMRNMGPFPGLAPAGLARFFRYIATEPLILIGTALLTLGFASFLAVLSWADVSIVVPASAGTHLIVTLLARYYLHEDVPVQRWMGVFVVMLGIALVMTSQKAPAEQTAKEDTRGDREVPPGRTVRAGDGRQQGARALDGAGARLSRGRYRRNEPASG